MMWSVKPQLLTRPKELLSCHASDKVNHQGNKPLPLTTKEYTVAETIVYGKRFTL